MKQTTQSQSARGFTVAEALMAATILAIVASSVSLPFAAGTQRVNEAARFDRAVALGQAMMEEVIARPFYAPGQSTPSSGAAPAAASRASYDNIDDFRSYTESTVGLRDYNNNPITDPACAGFYRDVTVTYVTFTGQAAADTNSYVNVRVRVFDGPVAVVTLNRIVAREW